ncbi:hypothetical protein Tco_0682256 [Tanacetum coccineum]|uniref:Uncharacterized protein n=1 Tax=Tanacetum coccineum TaxID=301880 RepID=A0ABQ4XRB6_9ASTR
MRKRDRDDEGPLVGPNQGKKTKRSITKESKPSKKSSTSKESSKGKSPAKTSKFGKSVTAEEPVEEPVFEMASDDIEQTIDDMANDADQPPDDSTQTKDKAPKQDWFKQPPRSPTPDPEWNKRQFVVDQPKQPWFNQMVSAAKDPLSFDELMAIPIDFSKYAMNRLKIDNLTQAHLVGPVYELLKGTCTSNIELEYNIEECFKALTDRLDWNNPEGDCYSLDLTKPLPLKGRSGCLTIATKYFFNNDLEFLKSLDPEKKYTTSITKTKAARYEIMGIEDVVLTLWSATKVGYNKDAEKGIKHWGERCKLWYRSQINKISKNNVYSTQKILSVVSVSVKKLHGYGHLEEIVVRRTDCQLFQLDDSDIIDLIVALRMFTRSLIIKRRVFGTSGSEIRMGLTKGRM